MDYAIIVGLGLFVSVCYPDPMSVVCMNTNRNVEGVAFKQRSIEIVGKHRNVLLNLWLFPLIKVTFQLKSCYSIEGMRT